MKIKITMDSACDLTPELIEKHNISVIPMHIVCDGQDYLDNVNFTVVDLFAQSDAGKSCSTAAINATEFEEFFDTHMRDHDAIIHISLSSEISVCFQNAGLAAGERAIYPVDSRSLSSGAGALAVYAAELAEQGMDVPAILAELARLVERTETSFVIDSLKYLHRGGRCSSVAALGANILKLKPCIEMREGTMSVGKKYRGNFDTIILQYVRERLQGRDDVDYKRIFMAHPNGVTQETLDNVRRTILECGPFEEIIDCAAGCTISNHAGPVTLGLLFCRK